jgi:hypothetical protein
MLNGMCFAQEPAPDNLIFMGVRYGDIPKLPLVSIGYGGNITGNLWNFTYTDVGNYQSLNTELAFMKKFGKLSIGPLAGPNADWQTSDNADGISYLVGAAGLLTAYDFKEFGVWGYIKYKFTLSDDNLYKDGYVGGIGIFHRFTL